MIDPVSLNALNGTSGTSSPTSSMSAANDQISQQQFLTLFIAQLQHQDPLSPMEPEQLTAQLAQLSILEQLHGINDRLDTLAATSKQTTATTALGLLGRTVDVDASTLAVKSGTASPIAFTLGQGVADVTVKITNASGQTLRTVTLGPTSAGEHTFTFDGKTDAGAGVADGTYSVSVSSQATAGATPVAVPALMRGRVEGVDLASDPPTLTVNGQTVTFDRVRSVRDSGDDA